MKTFNEIELNLNIKIQIKDEKELKEIGFNFEKSSEEILYEYFHNTAEYLRWNKKYKGEIK